jgi:hypothetical protein
LGALGIAIQQRVFFLVGGGPGVGVLHELLGGGVAWAEGANLAFVAQLVEHVERVFQRRRLFLPVGLKQVDVIGVQTLQRLLDLVADRIRSVVDVDLVRAVVRDRVIIGTKKRAAGRLGQIPSHAAFGGEHDPVAPPGKPGDRFADDGFGVAHAVHRRGVDEVDAGVERGVNRFDGSFVFLSAPHPPADRPRPQGDARGGDVG